MTLIDDDVFPIVLVEPESVFENEVISGKTYVPFGGFHYAEDIVSGGWISSINDFTNGWCPFLEFIDPVGHGR